MRRIALLALVTALVTAPSKAQDAPTAITDARNAAVAFALTMDLVTTSLASTCAKDSEALAANARVADASWKARNGQLVDSAHKYLLFARAVVAEQRGPEAGQAFYEEQRTRFVADAHTALTESFPGGEIDSAGCERVLTRIAEGAMDLAAKPALHQSLVEIDAAISHLTGNPGPAR